MKLTESQENEELALLAELARPVVHECNNFLNNLLLQLVISAEELPESQRADWERIGSAGKNLGRLLQQWQRQRTSFADGPARAEVQPLVQELVDATRSAADPVLLSLRMPPEPVWLACPRTEAKRLYSILLRHVLAELRALEKKPRALEMQVRLNNGNVIFQFQEADSAPTSLWWQEFDANVQSGTLLVTACRSLTERLGGSMSVESAKGRQPALLLALPAG